MSDLRDQFAIFLSDHQAGMSQFQDDYLVTARAGLTEYGQYKQALRELFTRYASLAQAYRDAELLACDIEERERRIADVNDDLELRRLAAQQRYDRAMLLLTRKRISELETEFVRFWQQAEMFKQRVGELTPERRREYEREYWLALTAERFLAAGGNPNDPELLRNIAAFPPDLQRQAIEMIEAGYERVRAHYLNRGDDFADLPLPDGRMSKDEIRALIDSAAGELLMLEKEHDRETT